MQWLTAGRGIVHSEMFPLLDRERAEPARALPDLAQPAARRQDGRRRTSRCCGASASRACRARRRRARHRGHRRRRRARRACGAPPPPPNSWAARADSRRGDLDASRWRRARAGRCRRRRAAPTARSTSSAAASCAIGERAIAPRARRSRCGPTSTLALENGADEAELLLLQGRPIGEPVAQLRPVRDEHARRDPAGAFADYQRTRFGGWPWPRDDPVHPREQARFARHADGRVEHAGRQVSGRRTATHETDPRMARRLAGAERGASTRAAAIAAGALGAKLILFHAVAIPRAPAAASAGRAADRRRRPALRHGAHAARGAGANARRPGRAASRSRSAPPGARCATRPRPTPSTSWSSARTATAASTACSAPPPRRSSTTPPARSTSSATPIHREIKEIREEKAFTENCNFSPRLLDLPVNLFLATSRRVTPRSELRGAPLRRSGFASMKRCTTSPSNIAIDRVDEDVEALAERARRVGQELARQRRDVVEVARAPPARAPCAGARWCAPRSPARTRPG